MYFLVNGVWLQVTVEDYKKALPGGQLTDELCKILFKSIEAPFNIMGTPVFQDYYVTHSWGETSTMSFLPHTESSKKVPSSGQTPKEQLLAIKMASTNDPDAELNAFLIAVGIGLLVIAGVVYEGIDLYFTKKSIELIVFIAPKLLGSDGRPLLGMSGLNELSDAIEFKVESVEQVGADIKVTLRPR